MTEKLALMEGEASSSSASSSPTYNSRSRSESSATYSSSPSTSQSPLEIEGVRYEPSDLFEIEESEERISKRFRTKQVDATISISPLIEKSSQPEEAFDAVIQAAIEANVPKGMTNPHLALSIVQDESTKPFYLRLTRLANVVPAMLRREMERSAQSNAMPSPITDKALHMKMSWVDMPTASGKRSFSAMEDGDNITPVQGRDLCLPKAIAIGIAYCERAKNPNHWRSISRSIDKQEAEAKKLMAQAGVSKTKDYEIEDVQTFQHTIPQFQIVMMHGSRHRDAMFKGPYVGDDKVIGLRMKNGHVDHLKKIARLFGSHYYCSACDVLYDDKKKHYNCIVRCRLCGHHDAAECAGIEEIHCDVCMKNYASQNCFDRHQAKGVRGGLSYCEAVDRCDKCGEEKHEDRTRREHICYHSYCRPCQTDRPRGHDTCYVSPIPPLAEDFFKKTIIFDVESMALKDGNRNIHKPIVIVALRSCENCEHILPRNINDTGYCADCGGKKLWVWHSLDQGNEDKNILIDFCDWLFSNKGATALAHNLKGFDGQFILRHLAGQDTPLAPEDFILAGRKLMYLEAKGVRLVDSLNFLTMPLVDFPKTFDIKELKKGHFPHKFSKKEHFNYIGSMPSIEEYGNLDRMKKKARKELVEWYDANKKKQFDFRKDILDYCLSDVCVLHEGVRRFDNDCFKDTDVHVFHEAKTCAASAMMVFRRKFIKKNILAIEKSEGAREKQSKFALKYFRWLRKTENLNIEDARNVGEHDVPGTRLHVDGFIRPSESAPRGVAYEVDGCYYHMCPCTYSEEHTMHGMTAYAVRQRDIARNEAILKHYDLIVKKECEIRKEMKENPDMAKFFKDCDIEDPLLVKDAFFGGRTEPFKLYYRAKKGERILYLDVCSLYPTTNKKRPYPIGLGRKVSGDKFTVPMTKPEQLSVEGFVKCKILPPQDLFLPILTTRSHTKNVVPLCGACAEELDPYGKQCNHTEEERCLKGTFTSFELKLALKVGYKILEIYDARHYDEWTLYQKNADGTIQHGIMSQYMDTWIKKKAEASGWPRENMTEEEKQAFIDEYFEREGIVLDPSMMQKNAAARAVAKLLANSLWGKLGERNDRSRNVILVNPSHYFKLLSDGTKDILNIEVLTDDKIAVVYKDREEEDIDPIPTTSKASAVLTTAFARCTLYELMERIVKALGPERLLYCDTDSILFVIKDNEENPLKDCMGSFLGQLTSEIEDGWRCTEYVCQGPKAYAYRIEHSDGSVKEVVKCKGFPLTCEAASKIRFNQMKSFVTSLSRGKETQRIPISYDVFGIDKHHRVYTTTIDKMYSAYFDKRKIVRNTYDTLPYGFK